MQPLRNHYGQQQLSRNLPNGGLLRIADGLRCPHCGRVMQPFDFEVIDGSKFEITCGGCHHTLIACEAVT